MPGAGNDFEGISEGLDGQLFPSGEAFGEPSEMTCKGDLRGSASCQQARFLKQLAGDTECIGKAAFNLADRFVGRAFGDERRPTLFGFNDPVHDAVPTLVGAGDEHAQIRLS